MNIELTAGRASCSICGADWSACIHSGTIGLSRFFLEQCEDTPGYTWTHTRRLSLWLSEAYTWAHTLSVRPGYREGVVLLPVPFSVFEGLTPLKSRVVPVTPDTQFVTLCKSRVEGEQPRKKTMALVDELPDARFITAVLYRKDVLAEDNDRSTDADWELVALLCQMDADEPINTATLMANHFGADGGTATLMSPEKFEEELRRSYNYWKDKSFGVTCDEYGQT